MALALSEGATHVDAVEIDPVLQRLGRDLHPEHPYQDPRVSVHIDDGRAFLERTRTSYDLILFALPDSLTLVVRDRAGCVWRATCSRPRRCGRFAST